MRGAALVLAALVLLAPLVGGGGAGAADGPAAVPVSPVSPAEFGRQVEELVARYEAEGVTAAGVVAREAGGALLAQANPDQVFPAASLYKLFVLWKVQAEIGAGRLRDDSELVLEPEDYDAEDDEAPFAPPGSVVTVAEARRLMVTQSNNTAAWLLARTVGWEAIEALLRARGFARSTVVGEQLTSAREVTAFFEGVVDRTLDPALGPAEYAMMLDLLKAQELATPLAPELPAGAVFAHKTGSLPGVANDAGALLLPDGRVVYLTVLAEGDEAASAALMGEVAELVGRALGPGASSRYFPATGHAVGGPFLEYWDRRGGLARFGYPLTEARPERLEDGGVYIVQWFERARLEWHPENAPPYDVLLGQFGRRILATLPAAPTARTSPRQDYSYFEQTGHNVGPRFLAYWEANGGLAQFGYPLSEEFAETLEDGKPYTVQYFERARLEWHPENPAPFDILLGQFGRRLLAASTP